MSRSIGRHRYRLTIEEPVETQGSLGEVETTYQTIRKVWGFLRYTRTGDAGGKKYDGTSEYNLERLEFWLNPGQEIQYNWLINFRNSRYEIAAIQDTVEIMKVICYGIPLSSSRNP